MYTVWTKKEGDKKTTVIAQQSTVHLSVSTDQSFKLRATQLCTYQSMTQCKHCDCDWESWIAGLICSSWCNPLFVSLLVICRSWHGLYCNTTRATLVFMTHISMEVCFYTLFCIRSTVYEKHYSYTIIYKRHNYIIHTENTKKAALPHENYNAIN